MFIKHFRTSLTKSAFIAVVAAFLLTVGTPEPAKAGNWRVAPIKLNFDAKTRSDVITITNDDAQALSLEISAMQWLQDEEGQDDYRPATDLVFFPKQLVVDPHSERVVRTGIKVPAANREKNYRLFIRETPDRSQSGPTTVAIAVQFGIPVFVSPAEIIIAGAITETEVVDGTVEVRIENQGNSHFRINSVTFDGRSTTNEPLFSQEVSGWYLLNGSSRTFTTLVPNQFCRQTKEITIQVNTDRIVFNGQINVDPSMCQAP
ncbi:MAG: molecular chaperone [Desulfuromonadales bacterium]|nr:molecular chaperone [Desulfuromonadales bacterium]